MRNLLSANFARARKDWTFRIILIFFIVSNFVILWGQYQEQLLYNVYHPLDQVLFYYGFWSGVTTAVFASLFIGTEYGDGTIRNKLIAGHKRADIYLSNLITCIAVSFALCVLSMVELFVLGLPLMELGLKASAQTVIISFVGELILVAAYCSIFTLISMVSSKKEISVVASILLAVVLILAATYTYGRLSAPEFIKGYTITDAATGLSHDIRTPLTAICGYLDLLKKRELGEQEQTYLLIIENRAAALKQMTEELFCYSVVASASNAPKLKPVEINRVLEESISAYYATLTDRGIKPEISIPEHPVVCMVDVSALSRIFANILSNAVKYSDGDLLITLSNTGELTFANHASGLDEISTGKLFDRFYTVENAAGSTGLGLSIARTLTEQMHGQLSARYAEGMLYLYLSFPG